MVPVHYSGLIPGSDNVVEGRFCTARRFGTDIFSDHQYWLNHADTVAKWGEIAEASNHREDNDNQPKMFSTMQDRVEQMLTVSDAAGRYQS